MPKRRASGEGNIRKRKDGRWEGRYTVGHVLETGKAIEVRAWARKNSKKVIGEKVRKKSRFRKKSGLSAMYYQFRCMLKIGKIES